MNTSSPRRADAHPMRLLLAYAAAVPLLIVPLPIGQSLGAADLLFPFAVWTLLRASSRKIDPLMLTFAAFVVAASLSTIYTLMTLTRNDSQEIISMLLIVRMYAIYIPLLLVLAWRAPTEDKIVRIAHVIMVSGSLACLIGIVLHSLGIRIRDTQQVNWFGNGVESTLRAGGLLGNSGDFGHLAAVLGVTAVAFGLLRTGSVILPLIAVGLAAYATYISSSRAAMLHLVVGLVIMLPLLFKRRPALSFGLLAVGSLVAVASAVSASAVSFQTEFLLRRLDVLNLTGESLFFSSDSRLSSWETILRLIYERPFTGIGYGRMVALTGGAGDNSFLTLAVEIGLIGAICFAVFWATILIAAARIKDPTKKWISLAIVVSEIAHMLTIDTHRMWATAPIALLVIGLSLVSGRSPQGREPWLNTPDRNRHLIPITSKAGSPA